MDEQAVQLIENALHESHAELTRLRAALAQAVSERDDAQGARAVAEQERDHFDEEVQELKQQLATARRDVLREAANMVCYRCAAGEPLIDNHAHPYHIPKAANWHCEAYLIHRALAAGDAGHE